MINDLERRHRIALVALHFRPQHLPVRRVGAGASETVGSLQKNREFQRTNYWSRESDCMIKHLETRKPGR